MRLETLPRVLTGHYPTPLEHMSSLTRHLGGASLWIKRDDMTGLALGGNKTRKLDFLIADALQQGYTAILTYGGVHTNHGRLTAAAAVKFGLKPILLCYGTRPERASGNLLIDRILGCDIRFMDTTPIRTLAPQEMPAAYQRLRQEVTREVVAEYQAQGEKVYIMPMGGHHVLGAPGYILAVQEMMEQFAKKRIAPEYLVTGLGSTGTYAGLWLGAQIYKAPFKVIGVAVAPLSPSRGQEIVDHINEVSRAVELGITCAPDDLWIETAYSGAGYNVPDPDTRESMYLLARTEGILVDPCYTGKVFRGFADMVRIGKIPSGSTAVFLHSGGTPGIFTEEHCEAMQSELW